MVDQITLRSLAGRGSLDMVYGDRRGYWLDDVDWGQVNGSHNTYSYYNQTGVSIVSTTLGPRDVAISGFVVENQATMRDRLDALNAFVSPAEDYELIFHDRKIQIRPDQSVIYSREFTENNQKLRRFLIQATAPQPLFSGAEDTVTKFDSTQDLFHFPSNLGMAAPFAFGLTAKTYSATILNSGGFPNGIVIQIAFSGTVQNVKVRNVTANVYIGVNYTFSVNDQLTICTIPGSKSITLLDSLGLTHNLIKYRDYQTTWIQLLPGENLISVESDDVSQQGNMDISVSYTPLFLEVE